MITTSEIRGLASSYVVLKDKYAELANALGSPSDTWFGDPLESHDAVLARALSLKADQRFLRCLEAAGVDNWQGYDDAVLEWRAGP